MNMRRIFSCFLLCAAAVIPQVSPAAVAANFSRIRAAAPAYAPLSAASFYTGEERTERGERRVELYLLDGNFFVLRQTDTLRGRTATTRDMTGIWRQVEGGALLQLSNRHGLTLRLNIGVRRNLYGDFLSSPNGFPQSLVLKESPFRMPSFSVMGRLDRVAGRATLTDSATGRVFTPAAGEALTALPEENPLFVDAVILPAKNGCAVERIRSFSSRFPSQADTAPTDRDFAASVEGVVWLLPPLPGLPAASCAFRGRGKGRGSLEVTGPGLRLAADYDLRGRSLSVAVSKEDSRMVNACGAEALPRMLASVRSWSLENDALVLTATDGQSFLLEKAAPALRAGGGRAAAPKGHTP